MKRTLLIILIISSLSSFNVNAQVPTARMKVEVLGKHLLRKYDSTDYEQVCISLRFSIINPYDFDLGVFPIEYDILEETGTFLGVCKSKYITHDSLLKDMSSDDLRLLLDTIKQTQYIVENEEGKLSFFREKFRGLHRGRSLHEYDCDRSIYLVHMPAFSDMDCVMDFKLYLNDLKVFKSDKVVRLHYLFIPDKRTERMGLIPFVLTSNWFTLEPLSECEEEENW